MSSKKIEAVLLRYPYLGKVCRVTDRGFGHIRTPIGGEEFIHLRDHSGRRLDTMEGLVGKSCVYVIGGHPFRYSQGKQGWDRAVVEWRLLDDVDFPEMAADYKERRSEAISVLDKGRLYSVLSAEWYVRLWHNKTGEKPQAVLQVDRLLTSSLYQRLGCANDAEELIRLLASICESPWYVVRNSDRAAICERFFQPSGWPLSVFVTHTPVNSCRGYDTVRPLCGEYLKAYIRKARTIAVDLESDGEVIFEFGWRNACGTGVCRARGGLSREQLFKAVDDCLSRQIEPCLVGHNLLEWDLPILRKYGVSFPESLSIWDTLVASWILEPWRSSHALVVGKGAHTADADAAACYDLFERQIAQLAKCLEDQPHDISSLVDRLYENPQLLSGINERDYPSDLAETLFGATVFPSCRASQFAWQKGCRLKLLTQENRLADPVLIPERCRDIAEREPSLSAKAVTIVVTDARFKNVYVRLSNLPAWLVDDRLKTSLKQAHVGDETGGTDNAIDIYLAEDLFRLSEDDIARRFADGTLAVFYPGDVAATWQEVCCQRLTEADVHDWFPKVTQGRTGQALFSVQKPNGDSAWLLYTPPGLNVVSASSWSLLPPMPSWLQVSSIPSQIGNSSLAWIPRWRDGDAIRLDVDRLFVSPETANRPLYLADLTHCLLNLLRSYPEDEVFVLGVRWPEEAAELQRNLVQLGLSAEHPGTPLRKLESICQKGLRILVCARDQVPKFIQAANWLGKKIQIIFDEVPLHDWYAILNAPVALRQTDESLDIPDSAGLEGDENEVQTDRDRQSRVGTQVLLQGSDIRSVTDVFLQGWLQGMGIRSLSETATCLILDARIVDHHVAKATRIPCQDVPFYALEELVDENTLKIFYNICYPKRQVKDIPNDYESYRAFLKENWGYDDFRPGTQRSAIEKLIQSNRDILLRLPTGGGKSIVFHLPALLRSYYSGRLTVVITPLRALMRDQVEGLWRKHFTESVDFLSGGRDAWLNHEVYQGVLDGRIRLVFVAPERFRVSRFTEALERRRRMDGGIEFVVFDETHCISEWGFEFRPDYLYAAQYVAQWFKTKELPGNPHRLLLTSATVTQRNRVDLERELGLGQVGDYEDLPEDMPHPIQPYIVLESFDLNEDEDAPSDEKFEKTCEILRELKLDHSAALVFVRRRKDCHRISEALNAQAALPNSGLSFLHALPFHAGLPEAVKIEACDLLRARKANVLVCTKAFGMGMDIPHLHACVHHRPPTFIEDYLQEVGRIGRDEGERERAGHDVVTATLLYNQDDIERNLGLLHYKTVMPPDLQDFFGYCIANGVLFKGVGKSLCIVPGTVRISETKEFDENQVTNCLFWLERMGVLRIEGRHPPFLHLSLNLPGLRNHAEESSLASRIAMLLLSLVTESYSVVKEVASTPTQDTSSQPQAENIFSRVIKGLLRGVLALISPSEEVESQLQVPVKRTIYDRSPMVEEIDVSLSMPELMSRCGGISVDDLFAGLFQLSKAGVLSVRKSFVVLRNSVPSGEEFFDLLQITIERLLKPTDGQVEFLERKQFESELRVRYRKILSVESQDEVAVEKGVDHSRLLTRRIQREVYRAISTSLRILRYAGVELREGLSESGVVHYARAIPESVQFSIASSVNESIQAMRKLLACVSSAEDMSNQAQGGIFEIPLTDIIDALGGDVRIGRLKKLMKLLESAGFYGFEGGLSDWMSLVTLNTQEPLPSYVVDSDEDTAVQRVYREMLEKYEIQVLRAQAMVLLAAMPAENRKEYIDRYFQCVKAEDLQGLLEDTVGDVDDEVLEKNLMLQDLLSQVRQERFSEEIKRLNDKQLAVCRAPFDHTLLVNAGPGSGKTHVLMMRCAHLIHVQRINPAEILVLAFNRAVVYEIRDRIRRLFRALGYGSYANRLDVSTFHSFALRHQQATELHEEDSIGQALHLFAETMRTDGNFARAVGSRYKTVLVDEFQDMNEDFYGVVKLLFSNCRGGGMVIGDDDQDILAWDRRRWQEKYKQNISLDAVHYFAEFRKSLKPDEHNLTINYRSCPEIVERASGMIQKVAVQVGFSRIKESTELTASRTETGIVETPLDRNNCHNVVIQSLERNESVAVLCRSNKECRQIYELLTNRDGIPKDKVDLLGAEDFPLYQLRHCGALLDICYTRKDYDFVESYIWQEFIGELEERGLANREDGHAYLELLYALVKEEFGRPRVRDLQSFINGMRCSDIDRLKAKVGLGDTRGKLTIATIHKVKGLEYDTVLILPSMESFPFKKGLDPKDIDSAEEARLYYVAMTRARNRLYLGWDDREKAWWQCAAYTALEVIRSCYFTGSPKDCYVSWPGQKSQVRDGLQNYIEREVFLGDPLELEGRDLIIHAGRAVGRLSGKMAESLQQANVNPQLRVSNVIRYTSGDYFRRNHESLWESLDDQIKRQGWFYLVLFEEA